MSKRVVKVAITGYYLVDDDLPEDVLGAASIEEYVSHRIQLFNKGDYEAEDVVELAEIMVEDMATKPTVRLELKQ
jgi:hypothetical protein